MQSNKDIDKRVKEILDIHQAKGFKGCVEYLLGYIFKVLEEVPDKPSSDDKKAQTKLAFLNKLVLEKDKSGLTVLDKITKDWLQSGYCDICFSNVLYEFCNYLDPNKDVCLDNKDLVALVKKFREENIYHPAFYYKKYKLKNRKFVVIDDKYKFGIQKESNNSDHLMPVSSPKTVPGKVDNTELIESHKKNNLGLIFGVISLFLEDK